MVKSLQIEDSQWWAEHFPQISDAPIIIGCDEAGFGSLGGNLYVAACARISNTIQDIMLNDSKKLSAKQRETSAAVIRDPAGNWIYDVQEVSPQEIDKGNVSALRFEAAKKAALNVFFRLKTQHAVVIMDGNKAISLDDPRLDSLFLIKGDGKSASIAAASILAKTSKDEEMKSLGEQYPGYGFEKHQGYFTAAHFEAVCKLGVLPVHRRSYISEERWLMIEKYSHHQ